MVVLELKTDPCLTAEASLLPLLQLFEMWKVFLGHPLLFMQQLRKYTCIKRNSDLTIIQNMSNVNPFTLCVE